MKNINRIMVCVDLSDYSLETIESALTIVRGQKTKILLLNVINSKEVDIVENVSLRFPEKISSDTYIQGKQTERQQILNKMIEEYFIEAKDRITILFRVGIPYKAILETIKQENIDLVVIASKGRSDLIGTLHGSTAEKVFRHSPVPVLSVRNREKFSRKQ